MNEIRSHTGLRGVAALLVVMYHFRGMVPWLDGHTSFFANANLMVGFFFILSGYILMHVYGVEAVRSRERLWHYLVARFARIYPLHLATLLFLLLLFTVRHAAVNWWTFSLNLAGVHAWGFLESFDWNFPSWSISVELLAYLTFPFVCLGLIHVRGITFVTLVLVVAWRILSLDIQQESGWEAWAVPMFLPLFFLGILVFGARKWVSALPETIVSLAQIVFLLVVGMEMHAGSPRVEILVAFALLVLLTSQDRGVIARGLGSRPILVLGAWSYSVYLLHIPVKYCFNLVWGKFIGEPVGAVAFITLLAVTVAAAGASYHIFEVPCRNLLRSRLAPLRRMERPTRNVLL